jgi:hypothetical protein
MHTQGAQESCSLPREQQQQHQQQAFSAGQHRDMLLGASAAGRSVQLVSMSDGLPAQGDVAGEVSRKDSAASDVSCGPPAYAPAPAPPLSLQQAWEHICRTHGHPAMPPATLRQAGSGSGSGSQTIPLQRAPATTGGALVTTGMRPPAATAGVPAGFPAITTLGSSGAVASAPWPPLQTGG